MDDSSTPRLKGASSMDPTDSASSIEAPGGGGGSGSESRGGSAPPVAPPTPSSPSFASPSRNNRVFPSSSSRSPVQPPKRPLVRVEPDPRTGYWVVTIRCTDRPKLLFDTLCTLADLDYDVYHASIDSTEKSAKDGAAGAAAGSSSSSRPPSAPGGPGGSQPCLASQEYYIRPRDGNADWDVARAEQLVAMLEASIQRRLPRGLKVHVRSADRFGCLAALAGVLRGADLAVTRAKVRTYAAAGGGHNGKDSSSIFVAGPSAGHTLYVMAASGGPPDRAAVEAACAAVGGKLVEPGDEAVSVAASGGEHAFSYSFLSRRWSARGASATWRPGEGSAEVVKPSSSAAATAAGACGGAMGGGGGGDGRNAVPFNNDQNAMLSGLSPGLSSEGSF